VATASFSAGHRQGERRERRRRGLLLRLQLVEGVERLARGEHRVAHRPGQAAAGGGEVGDVERGVLRPEALERRRQRAQRVAAGGDAVFRALAEPHQQHALGGEPRHAPQQQRRARLLGEVAGGQRAAQRARGRPVGGLRAARERLAGADREHHAAGLRLLGRDRPYAKLHRFSPMKSAASIA
jgi:hypothetical protein